MAGTRGVGRGGDTRPTQGAGKPARSLLKQSEKAKHAAMRALHHPRDTGYGH